jgi:5-deoxy-glucuronate isomerase
MAVTTDRPGTPARLLRRASEASEAPLHHVTAEAAGWEYLTFEAHRLQPGLGLRREADDQEVLILALEGRVSVRAGARFYEDVGTRESVFDGPPPGAVLVAPGTGIEVETAGGALLALGSAPGGEPKVTRLIEPGDVFAESRGSGNTSRRINHVLPPDGEAGRLIAFEVFTPGGNWSSFPAHKHDTQDPPRESYLEEIYYYRFARPSGFAVQRVYTSDRSLDDTLTARDGDLVLVPRGYHVVAAAPGYDCYYLNVMAGPTREWRFTVDPDHEWLMDWDPNKPKT